MRSDAHSDDDDDDEDTSPLPEVANNNNNNNTSSVPDLFGWAAPTPLHPSAVPTVLDSPSAVAPNHAYHYGYGGAYAAAAAAVQTPIHEASYAAPVMPAGVSDAPMMAGLGPEAETNKEMRPVSELQRLVDDFIKSQQQPQQT